MKKIFPVILSVLLLLPAPAMAQKKDAARPPAPVVAEPARVERMEDMVEALGTLRANETVTLTATVTEAVTAINFDDGQRVEKGDVLVEMTSGQEKAELEAERATVAEAERQVERIEPLVKSGAASKSLLDQRRRELQTARARLEAVQSRIGDRIIVAPFSGVLGLRGVSVGAVLQPGMRITTIDDDSTMKLDFQVPSVFLASLKPGLPITATARAFEGREFHGTISSIDSQIDPVTRSITVRAVLPNEDRVLKPGLLMSVNILKNPRDAVVIPEEALVPEGRSNAVFVVEGGGEQGIARKRPVTIGTRRPGKVEIVEGLLEGERVVTHGTMRIADGAPVVVSAQAPGAGRKEAN